MHCCPLEQRNWNLAQVTFTGSDSIRARSIPNPKESWFDSFTQFLRERADYCIAKELIVCKPWRIVCLNKIMIHDSRLTRIDPTLAWFDWKIWNNSLMTHFLTHLVDTSHSIPRIDGRISAFSCTCPPRRRYFCSISPQHCCRRSQKMPWSHHQMLRKRAASI